VSFRRKPESSDFGGVPMASMIDIKDVSKWFGSFHVLTV
jgi:hypothetical protein